MSVWGGRARDARRSDASKADRTWVQRIEDGIRRTSDWNERRITNCITRVAGAEALAQRCREDVCDLDDRATTELSRQLGKIKALEGEIGRLKHNDECLKRYCDVQTQVNTRVIERLDRCEAALEGATTNNRRLVERIERLEAVKLYPITVTHDEDDDLPTQLIWAFEITTLDCKEVRRVHQVKARDAVEAAKKVHKYIDDNCTCEPRIVVLVRKSQVDIDTP